MSTATVFQAGHTYSTRSICNHDCIYSIMVAKRTAKTLTTSNGKRLGISLYDGVEQVMPLGRYSMAPHICADSTTPHNAQVAA